MSAHTRRLMGSLGLLLEADGSSIPSTAADYITVPRETEDQRRERLAAEAGHTLTTCPECGGRATRESVLVYRTGEGTLQQTLIRCWRPGTAAKPRCQVQTLSEEPVGADAFTALEEMLAKTASEEETMSEMTDHEMRIRLAEAMGWTDLDWYFRPGWITGLPPGDRPRDHVPNPLESDRDAARLRAWCVGQGWELEVQHRLRTDLWEARVIVHDVASRQIAASTIDCTWNNPLRRERLALCRAVLRALDAVEAGGEA